MVVGLTRRLAALIALLALVFGAPYLLWVLGRGFLPDRLPSLPQVWDALTSRDTGALFMGALVVVGFAAWAVFTVCVLVDIAGRVAGRTWTLRIPGLRVPQAAASSLVSAVLAGSVLLGMTGTATAQPLTPLPHVTAAAPAAAAGVAETHTASREAVITATRVPAATTAPVGPEWTVREGDTLWSIAEKTMGDPLRYQEIYELNRDTVQPDGGRLVTPETWLEDGWTLRLPADAAIPAPASASTPPAQAGTVIVQAGDTLSQIAQDHLDDATRYPEIAAQNHITDPDRIDVGEIIVLPEPGGASADAAAVPPGTAPVGTPPADTAPTTATAGDPSPPPVDPQPGAPVSPPATDAPSTVGADRATDPADTPAPTLTADAPAPVPSAAATPPFPTSAPEPGTAATPAATQPQPSTPAAADADDHSTAAVLAGLTALTAGAAWSALRAVRRRGHRRRVPGRQAAPARLGAARAERQLREKALAADAGWLNAALRALAAALATQPGPGVPGRRRGLPGTRSAAAATGGTRPGSGAVHRRRRRVGAAGDGRTADRASGSRGRDRAAAHPGQHRIPR